MAVAATRCAQCFHVVRQAVTVTVASRRRAPHQTTLSDAWVLGDDSDVDGSSGSGTDVDDAAALSPSGSAVPGWVLDDPVRHAAAAGVSRPPPGWVLDDDSSDSGMKDALSPSRSAALGWVLDDEGGSDADSEAPAADSSSSAKPRASQSARSTCCHCGRTVAGDLD